MTRVYLSSPFDDLVKHRQVVYRALRQSGIDVIAMEDYVARDCRVLSACLEDIRTSDLYVGIMAFRYGSVVLDEDVRDQFDDPSDWLGLSVTEAEYQYAKDVVGIPCLTFVAKESAPWSPQFIDSYVFADETNGGGNAARFRARMMKERLSGEFSTPFDLASMVQSAIARAGRPAAMTKRAVAGDRNWLITRDGTPFPGLLPFPRRMSRVYFGREAEVRHVCDLVSGVGPRFVIVSGGSGSGKSSMVSAGVIPNILEVGFGDCLDVRSVRIRPTDGADALEALIDGLVPELSDPAMILGDLRRRLVEWPGFLAELLSRSLAPARPGAGLLIHVDQLEELFAPHNQTVVDTFVAILTELQVVTSIRVIACVRADYLVNCLEFDRILDIFHEGGHYPLGPVDIMAMAEIIKKPCHVASLSISDGLVSRIIQDLGTGPGVLPLLAFLLEQLFLERSGDELRVETYDSLGGATGAVARIAERATAELVEPEVSTEELHGLFSRMVLVDLDGTPLKRATHRISLSSRQRALADRLVEARRLIPIGGVGVGV